MRKNEMQNELKAYYEAMSLIGMAIDTLQGVDFDLMDEVMKAYLKVSDKVDAIDAYRNYEDYEK